MNKLRLLGDNFIGWSSAIATSYQTYCFGLPLGIYSARLTSLSEVLPVNGQPLDPVFVLEQIKEIIARETGLSIDSIRPEDLLTQNLDLDSLCASAVIMEIEDTFGVIIDDSNYIGFINPHISSLEMSVQQIANEVIRSQCPLI